MAHAFWINRSVARATARREYVWMMHAASPMRVVLACSSASIARAFRKTFVAPNAIDGPGRPKRCCSCATNPDALDATCGPRHPKRPTNLWCSIREGYPALVTRTASISPLHRSWCSRASGSTSPAFFIVLGLTHRTNCARLSEMVRRSAPSCDLNCNARELDSDPALAAPFCAGDARRTLTKGHDEDASSFRILSGSESLDF